MRDIQDADIIWDPTGNFTAGRTASLTTIAIHWWDDPAVNPTLAGVRSWFKNASSQVSAHFVVSDNTIVQMVALNDTAWHASAANPYTIGIECDPNFPGNTYNTVASLVRFLRNRTGLALPLAKHKDLPGNSTQCPGTTDVALIQSLSTTPIYEAPNYPAGYIPRVQVWNGNAWVEKLPVLQNGSSWQDAEPKTWNGTAWV